MKLKCATQQKFNQGIKAGNIQIKFLKNKFENNRKCST
jgi:hypothetical protein